MPLPKTITITEEQIEKVMALFDHLTMIRKSDIGGALGNNSMNVYRAIVDELINRGMIRCIQINTSILYERMSFDHDQSDVRKDLMGLLHSHFDGGRSATAASVATELALNINVVKATLEELRKQGKICGRFVGNLCIYAQQERGTVREATPEELQKVGRRDPLQVYLESRKGKPELDIQLVRSPKKPDRAELKSQGFVSLKEARGLLKCSSGMVAQLMQQHTPEGSMVRKCGPGVYVHENVLSGWKEKIADLRTQRPVPQPKPAAKPKPEAVTPKPSPDFKPLQGAELVTGVSASEIMRLLDRHTVRTCRDNGVFLVHVPDLKNALRTERQQKPKPEPAVAPPKVPKVPKVPKEKPVLAVRAKFKPVAGPVDPVIVDIMDLDEATRLFVQLAHRLAGPDFPQLEGKVLLLAATLAVHVTKSVLYKFMKKHQLTDHYSHHQGHTYIPVEVLRQYLENTQISVVNLRSSHWPAGHITVHEASELLGWSIQKIYKALNQKQLHAMQVGDKLAFDPSAVLAFKAHIQEQYPPEGWVRLRDVCEELQVDPSGAKDWLDLRFIGKKCWDAGRQWATYYPPEAIKAYREHRQNNPIGPKATPELIQALRNRHPLYFGADAPDLPSEVRRQVATEHNLTESLVRLILKGQIRPEIQPQLPNWPIWSEDRLLKIHHHPLRDEQLALIEGWSVQHIQEIKAATPEYLSAYAAARRLEIERRKRK
ncbi:helix-turn-helix domain-containing protein [Deinococcus misasensis]|uniref:helix-turn-helix domain-containing protein n=1 Tax=Deinococcus misasensis TaxID=392413 RepID=UPI00054D9554|nr:helix-turn-helix domain-containing protein [Deinococcus misasensis]